MSLTMLGMLFGILVDVAVAGKFGTTAAADIVIIALVVPLFIDTIVREGTKFSLVPLLVHYQKKEAKRYSDWLSGVYSLTIILGLVLLVAFELLAHLLITYLVAPGLGPEAQQKATLMLRLMGLIFLLAPQIALLSAYLNSVRKFAVVAFRNLFVSVTILGVILIFWSSQNLIYYIAISYSIAFVLYFILLFAYSRSSGFKVQLLWLDKAGIRELTQAVSWPTFGFVARQGGRVLEKSIASLLMAGSVTAYHFSFRIFSAIQTVIGTSIATTGLPSLTEVSDQKELQRAKLVKQLKLLTVLVLPIVLIIAVFGELLIEIVYQRGGFDQNSVKETATALRYLVPGLYFNTMIPVLNSALYSMQQYKKIFYANFVLSIVNVAMAYLLAIVLDMDLIGISLSVSFSAVIGALVSLVMVQRCGIRLLPSKKS